MQPSRWPDRPRNDRKSFRSIENPCCNLTEGPRPTAGYQVYFASFDSSFFTVPAPYTTKPVARPNSDLAIQWIDTLDPSPALQQFAVGSYLTLASTLQVRDDLTTGYRLLATGYWLLATGYWLLATGYWLLATGY
ncbi:hypothetical protein H4I95_01282 [Botrytis cinerea]